MCSNVRSDIPFCLCSGVRSRLCSDVPTCLCSRLSSRSDRLLYARANLLRTGSDLLSASALLLPLGT